MFMSSIFLSFHEYYCSNSNKIYYHEKSKNWFYIVVYTDTFLILVDNSCDNKDDTDCCDDDECHGVLVDI